VQAPLEHSFGETFMDEKLIPSRDQNSRHPNWERVYQENPTEALPWFFPNLDPDFEPELGKLPKKEIRALDLGCGSGDQAQQLANRGYDVTGTDIASSAIRIASHRFPRIRFLVDDILQTRLKPGFDLILDRGCFHVIEPEHDRTYAAVLYRLCVPGGKVLLKCFTHDGPARKVGPRQLSPEDLRSIFQNRFEIERIVPTVFQGTTPYNPRAWLVVLNKKGVSP
jgi:SAM-dependent methyltransferase